MAPKGIAAIILAKKKPKETESEDDMDMGLDDASEEILDAIRKGDSSALKDALRSFVSMCKSSDY